LIAYFYHQLVFYTLENTLYDNDHTSLYNILQGIKRSSYLVLTLNTIGAYQQHDMCGALTPLLKMAKRVNIDMNKN